VINLYILSIYYKYEHPVKMLTMADKQVRYKC